MTTLNQFLNSRLRIDNVMSPDDPDSPPWWQDGVTVETDEETYFRYLEMLPPRFSDGNLFAFGEGAGQFVLFWKQAKRFFAHQLSQADTAEFCSLARVPLHL